MPMGGLIGSDDWPSCPDRPQAEVSQDGSHVSFDVVGSFRFRGHRESVGREILEHVGQRVEMGQPITHQLLEYMRQMANGVITDMIARGELFYGSDGWECAAWRQI